MELVIGNKNYSSWSLRAWLMLRAYGIAFNEVSLALFEDGFYEKLVEYSPAGKVPALMDGGVRVWDSLAICEYINDTYLAGQGWPNDIAQKAQARAVVSEIHSGFFALREELPMNVRASRAVELSQAAVADVKRIDQLWTELRQLNAGNGEWLFGEFSIADAFYAPVALRFNSYQVEVSEQSQAYIDALLTRGDMREWMESALAETQVIPHAELD